MNGTVSPKRKPTHWEANILQTLGIVVKEGVVSRGKWIRWMKPEIHKFKLNVDGSRRGQITTGGGVVRDSNGDIVIGFAVRFHHNDSLQAELEALWHGLQLCKQQHLFNLEVESDAELACKMIAKGSHVPWKYVYLIRRIRQLMEGGGDTRHIYRQANKVADGLATLAYGVHSRMEFTELSSLPRQIQKLLFIDRIGLLYFRPKCI